MSTITATFWLGWRIRITRMNGTEKNGWKGQRGRESEKRKKKQFLFANYNSERHRMKAPFSASTVSAIWGLARALTNTTQMNHLAYLLFHSISYTGICAREVRRMVCTGAGFRLNLQRNKSKVRNRVAATRPLSQMTVCQSRYYRLRCSGFLSAASCRTIVYLLPLFAGYIVSILRFFARRCRLHSLRIPVSLISIRRRSSAVELTVLFRRAYRHAQCTVCHFLLVVLRIIVWIHIIAERKE